ALTLADLCHVGRDRTADHRAELGGVTRQMRDPRAPNLVLAGEAGDIGTGAPDPAALDDGSPSPDRAICQATFLPPSPLPRIRTSNRSASDMSFLHVHPSQSATLSTILPGLCGEPSLFHFGFISGSGISICR